MAILTDKRNKRAVIIGATAMVIAITGNFLVIPWLDHWKEVRLLLAAEEKKLELIREVQSPSKLLKLAEVVPAFAMPQKEDEQRLYFEMKFNEQLQQAGINVTSLPQYIARGKKQPGLGVKLLRMKCQGKGNFNQVLDLLANLNGNPYLVSIEEIKIECGKKKRQEMELDLTVSTYVR